MTTLACVEEGEGFMQGLKSLKYVGKKLQNRKIWERVLCERLSEPLHLNLLSILVALVGSLRSKIYFDLIVRQQHAFAMLNAADKAKAAGLSRVTAVEFGVASGAGLLNICHIAQRIQAETGVGFQVFGFDTGAGMPPALDYRDHPEYYQAGDFPMQDRGALEASLPEFARLIIGDLSETIPAVIQTITAECPLAFFCIDVDYYSSTAKCLEICCGDPMQYLPMVDVYVDDIMNEGHNVWCGELLAIGEFNDKMRMRKIGPHQFIRERRLFKRARWISHMYTLHVFDHPQRSGRTERLRKKVLANPYLVSTT